MFLGKLFIGIVFCLVGGIGLTVLGNMYSSYEMKKFEKRLERGSNHNFIKSDNNFLTSAQRIDKLREKIREIEKPQKESIRKRMRNFFLDIMNV